MESTLSSNTLNMDIECLAYSFLPALNLSEKLRSRNTWTPNKSPIPRDFKGASWGRPWWLRLSAIGVRLEYWMSRHPKLWDLADARCSRCIAFPPIPPRGLKNSARPRSPSCVARLEMHFQTLSLVYDLSILLAMWFSLARSLSGKLMCTGHSTFDDMNSYSFRRGILCLVAARHWLCYYTIR